FVAMSAAGGPLVMAIVSCVAAAAAFVTRHPRRALYLLTTAGGGGLLNLELKRHFARARPALSQMLRLGHGYSFPSGHTMESLVVVGGLIYLAFRLLTTRWKKALVVVFGVAFVVSVAASRVYLGEHWISDVGAGASAGLLWLATTTIGYESFRRIHLLHQARDPSA
ncbi:MAG TPA: phosphatase PAP2 family protein, partial [Polyangia bacterium]|nr:phosphatase PAP2 family protein [Polyangia bacterium]